MQDQIVFDRDFVFDDTVATVFDDMIKRSIPDYLTLRETIFDIGANYVKPKTHILDIGSSTGLQIKPFIDRFGAHNVFHLVDVSKSMSDKLREMFRGLVDVGVVDVRNEDIYELFSYSNLSLALSVFTLQFIELAKRQGIINNVYQSLNKGGAFIVAEKILFEDDSLNRNAIAAYYDIKRRNGYTEEQIMTKKTALTNVMVPLPCAWNENMLKVAGFTKVEKIWQCLNFCAWIAIK